MFIIIPFLCLSATGHTEEITVAPYEQALIELINEAREDPLSMATSLEIDTEKILQDFPGLRTVLEDGLPPLRFNENIYEAARLHTTDMMDNGYYAHDSLDGRTYNDRIIESGYEPVVTGESLAMLGFANFIDTDEAVNLIFEKMFIDELSGQRERNILNPEFRDIGVSIMAGPFTLDGFNLNVYLATSDFASAEEYLIESELMLLINQARDNPLAMAASLGMDTEKILQNLPELQEILQEGGLPPMTFNRRLYAAGAAYIQEISDIFEEDQGKEPPPGSPWHPPQWSEYVSYDDPSYDERIQEQGYTPLTTGETAVSLKYESSTEPAQIARVLFEAMFRDELNPNREEERNIVNPLFNELGINYGRVIFVQEEEVTDTYHILVCDFGARDNEHNTSLVGGVYTDLDEDGLYTPGEGISGISVSIEGNATAFDIATNSVGGFNARVEPGEYTISALLTNDEVKTQTVELGEGNRAIWFIMEREENEETLDM